MKICETIKKYLKTSCSCLMTFESRAFGLFQSAMSQDCKPATGPSTFADFFSLWCGPWEPNEKPSVLWGWNSEPIWHAKQWSSNWKVELWTNSCQMVSMFPNMKISYNLDILKLHHFFETFLSLSLAVEDGHFSGACIDPTLALCVTWDHFEWHTFHNFF